MCQREDRTWGAMCGWMVGTQHDRHGTHCCHSQQAAHFPNRHLGPAAGRNCLVPRIPQRRVSTIAGAADRAIASWDLSLQVQACKREARPAGELALPQCFARCDACQLASVSFPLSRVSWLQGERRGRTMGEPWANQPSRQSHSLSPAPAFKPCTTL